MMKSEVFSWQIDLKSEFVVAHVKKVIFLASSVAVCLPPPTHPPKFTDPMWSPFQIENAEFLLAVFQISSALLRTPDPQINHS